MHSGVLTTIAFNSANVRIAVATATFFFSLALALILSPRLTPLGQERHPLFETQHLSRRPLFEPFNTRYAKFMT
ncbi:unnamed protein product [Agarophyton chilense]